MILAHAMVYGNAHIRTINTEQITWRKQTTYPIPKAVTFPSAIDFRYDKDL